MTHADAATDPLSAFLQYADRLHDLMGARIRAAYEETCPCGGVVHIGDEIPARERGQMLRYWLARHQHCTQPRRDADVDLADRSAP